MTYRLYRSVKIGDGTTPRTGFRPKVGDVLRPYEATLWNWDHPGRPLVYSLVLTTSEGHAAAVTDAEVVAVSPEWATIDEGQAWLEGPVDAALDARLEADGCSTAWRVSENTRRDVLRYLSKLHVCAQNLTKDKDALKFFEPGLSVLVRNLPLATRQRVAAWLTSKGLDPSQIGGNDTLRQALHYIITSNPWPVLKLGPLSI